MKATQILTGIFRSDVTTRVLLLLIAIAVWVIALTPTPELDLYGVENSIDGVSDQVSSIDSNLADLANTASAIGDDLSSIKIFGRD